MYESVSKSNPDIVFARVDTEAEQGLAGAFSISSIPTLMAIRDGVVLYSQAGALPEQALKNLVQAVRDVDMDEVHASVAGQQAGDETPVNQPSQSDAPPVQGGAPTENFCSNCGQPFEAGAGFCVECGTRRS